MPRTSSSPLRDTSLARSTVRRALLAALALPLAACGDAGDDAGSFSDVGIWQDAADTTADTWSPSDTTVDDTTPLDTSVADTAPPPPPPETEVDYDLRTPEAGATFLYIPSAALDALVIVDARDLAVHLVEVGLAPTIVRALPADQGAVVLDEGSSELSIVRPRPAVGGIAPDPAFSVETVQVVAGANRLVLSPDGALAFAFFATTRAGVTTGSLQDVTAVRLDAPTQAYNLAVGFRPEAVVFADADRLALIVCEDGLSGIHIADVTRDVFLPPVPTSPDPFEVPLDRELAPTPDGRFVLVRNLNRMALGRVDLQTGALALIALPDYPSDLDLTSDGRTAVVPLRTAQSAAVIDVTRAFDWAAPEPEPEPDPDPDPIDPAPAPAPTNPYVRFAATGAAFGSTVITADQTHALLFTTSPGVRAIGMLDLGAATAVIAPLTKELTAVVPSPDGTMAALVHRRASGDGDLQNRDAYSLLDLASGYTKLVVTSHPVTDVVFTRDAAELFALIPDPLGAAHEVQRVDAGSFHVRSYPVPDRPVFVGVLSANDKVAISLDNPTGWVTFVDTTTGRLLQLNSFELNSFIE